MRIFLATLLFGLLPLSTTLNCYLCTAGSPGCNDPFNATGSGVTTTGDMSMNTYCTKIMVVGSVTRLGIPTCAAISTNDNTLTTCCQTNLCNGAHGQYQTSILLILSIFLSLIKFKRV